MARIGQSIGAAAAIAPRYIELRLDNGRPCSAPRSTAIFVTAWYKAVLSAVNWQLTSVEAVPV